MTTFPFKAFRCRLLLFAFLFLTHLPVFAQITGADTRWSDSFREWILFGAEEEEIGSMYLRWPMDENWLDWVIELGEYTGQARQKWPGNPDAWEIRYANEVVTARTVFPGDPTQWRIITPGQQLTFAARHPNLREEWNIRNDRQVGSYAVYTLYEGDLRQWNVEDQTGDQLGVPMKLTMLFLALFHSTPKI